eukprot:gene27536-34267_t
MRLGPDKVRFPELFDPSSVLCVRWLSPLPLNKQESISMTVFLYLHYQFHCLEVVADMIETPPQAVSAPNSNSKSSSAAGNRSRTDSTGHHNPSPGGLLKQSLMHNNRSGSSSPTSPHKTLNGKSEFPDSEKSTDSGLTQTVPYGNNNPTSSSSNRKQLTIDTKHSKSSTPAPTVTVKQPPQRLYLDMNILLGHIHKTVGTVNSSPDKQLPSKPNAPLLSKNLFPSPQSSPHAGGGVGGEGDENRKKFDFAASFSPAPTSPTSLKQSEHYNAVVKFVMSNLGSVKVKDYASRRSIAAAGRSTGISVHNFHGATPSNPQPPGSQLNSSTNEGIASNSSFLSTSSNNTHNTSNFSIHNPQATMSPPPSSPTSPSANNANNNMRKTLKTLPQNNPVYKYEIFLEEGCLVPLHQTPVCKAPTGLVKVDINVEFSVI